MVKCNKGTQQCNCSSCNTAVSGGYTNGILTVTVGNSSGNILMPNSALKLGVLVTDSFSLNTGNSVVLSNRINNNFDVEVHFNGLLLKPTEYTIQNSIVTFVDNFVVSGNQEGNTEIVIKYYKL
jgi:hypothetical protein